MHTKDDTTTTAETLAELRDALDGPADKYDMEVWGLTEAEYRQALNDAVFLG